MKKAFTLTEVLITLGIISIVAVMTIPMLISNIQDQLFKVMYKKDVAMISEAMKLLYANDGITIQATFESVPQYVCRLKNYLKVKDVVFDCARIENYADDPNNNFDNWIVKSYELLWHDGGKWSTKDGLSIMRVITYDYSHYFFPDEPLSGQDLPAAFPAIAVRCCYPFQASLLELRAKGCTKYGFAFIVQWCRGTGGSEGAWEPNVNERPDGLSFLSFLEEDPRIESVGLWGDSYLALTGWALADAPEGRTAPTRYRGRCFCRSRL